MAQLKSTTVSGAISSNSIELCGTSSEKAPYIDFHFNNSTDEYTSRIIESSSGTLNIIGSLSVGDFDKDVSLEGHIHAPYEFVQPLLSNTTINVWDNQHNNAIKNLFGINTDFYFEPSSGCIINDFRFKEYITNMIFFRAAFEYTPKSDISAGTSVTLATLEGKVKAGGTFKPNILISQITTQEEVIEYVKKAYFLPPNNIALNCYLAETTAAKFSGLYNSSGKIIIRHSATLNAGTTYTMYVSGMFLR